MLLFKYPKMSKRGDAIATDIKEYESEIGNEELQRLVQQKLLQDGLEDPNALICEEYTDQEIDRDLNSVTWEHSYLKVEEAEENERQA